MATELCILIPCYNNPEGLKASLASLRYDPAHSLVLVVDDGSSKPLRVEENDCALPLKLLRLDRNSGIVAALNAGLEWIWKEGRARYIARLDCSDLCAPDRFYLQSAYLDAHPGIGLVGSWCRFQDPVSGASYEYTTPESGGQILKELHFRNVFIHPAVMFRTGLAQNLGGYSSSYPHCEDYELFWRMARESGSAILPQFLVTCATNPEGLSARNRKEQLQSRARIVKKMGGSWLLKFLGLARLSLLGLFPHKMIVKAKQKNII